MTSRNAKLIKIEKYAIRTLGKRLYNFGGEKSMQYFFLRKDFEALNAEIANLCDRIKAIGQEMGLACQEGAETFHDNFAYEDGERQQTMWTNRMRQLISIRNNARVVSPNTAPNRVSLGMTVLIRDGESDHEYTYKIGSYMTFGDKDPTIISYDSSLARSLMQAEVDEIREVVMRGHRRQLLIISIEHTNK